MPKIQKKKKLRSDLKEIQKRNTNLARLPCRDIWKLCSRSIILEDVQLHVRAARNNRLGAQAPAQQGQQDRHLELESWRVVSDLV